MPLPHNIRRAPAGEGELQGPQPGRGPQHQDPAAQVTGNILPRYFPSRMFLVIINFPPPGIQKNILLYEGPAHREPPAPLALAAWPEPPPASVLRILEARRASCSPSAGTVLLNYTWLRLKYLVGWRLRQMQNVIKAIQQCSDQGDPEHHHHAARAAALLRQRAPHALRRPRTCWLQITSSRYISNIFCVVKYFCMSTISISFARLSVLPGCWLPHPVHVPARHSRGLCCQGGRGGREVKEILKK